MIAYKGFDKDLKCKGFQYKIGKEYEEPEVILCEKGFHACTAPLDVFKYYAPATSRFCEVEIDGEIRRATDDSKISGTKIKIVREISLSELIEAQREYEKGKEECRVVTAGNHGAARAGKFGVATTESYGVAIAGDRGAAAAGYHSAAIAGDRGTAIAGDHGTAVTGYCGVATAGYLGAATAGYGGAATAGDFGTAVSGGSSSAGHYGLCIARGEGCRVKGGLGSVLVLVEEYKDSYDIAHCKIAVVDGLMIKADTWYTLQDGEFSEVNGQL